eukprot:1546065-Rhodomonas_salina.1
MAQNLKLWKQWVMLRSTRKYMHMLSPAAPACFHCPIASTLSSSSRVSSVMLCAHHHSTSSSLASVLRSASPTPLLSPASSLSASEHSASMNTH